MGKEKKGGRKDLTTLKKGGSLALWPSEQQKRGPRPRRGESHV